MTQPLVLPSIDSYQSLVDSALAQAYASLLSRKAGQAELPDQINIDLTYAPAVSRGQPSRSTSFVQSKDTVRAYISVSRTPPAVSTRHQIWLCTDDASPYFRVFAVSSQSSSSPAKTIWTPILDVFGVFNPEQALLAVETDPSRVLSSSGAPFASAAALEAAFPAASNPTATSYLGASWSIAKKVSVSNGSWSIQVNVSLSTGQITDTDVIAAIQSVPGVYSNVGTYATLSALNAAKPPASTQEGLTALVGSAGSRAEYILLNQVWQVRAAVVIGS